MSVQGELDRSTAGSRTLSRGAVAVLLALLLLISVGGALALADEAEEVGLLPPEVDSLAAFEAMAGSGASGAIEADTNPNAAETLPHTDLDRAEAAELLEGVFGNELEAPAEFFDELEGDAFRSDYAALVDPPAPDAPAGLLTSTLPLRTENESGEKEVVDLDLEAVGGDLEPRNPLVDVAIPSNLSDGISIPDAGVTINIASGDVERSASELGDSSAFYPNVREQTDVAISAVPTGVETYTHLRSPEAPRQEVFDLDIPSGSKLTATPQGGAEVVGADGKTLLTVQAPWAIDAQGTEVAADLEVNGHSVAVSVDPPADAAYPILLDPVFENHVFSNPADAAEWTGAYNPGFGYSRGGYGGPGLNVYAYGGSTSPGNQGSFNFYVPRYWSDQQAGFPKPLSFIRNMKIWGLTFAEPDEMGIPAQSRSAYPFMQLELRDETKNEFVWQYARMGNEGTFGDLGYVFNMGNPNENVGVKHGGFAMATFASSNNFFRYVDVQQASVEVTDKDLPAFAYTPSPPGWMNNTAIVPLEYSVTDGGLGIYSFRVTQPSAQGGSNVVTTSNNCVGTFRVPCPRTTDNKARAISYTPQEMAQGENKAVVTAVDAAGNQSEQRLVKIKVDHNGPAISLTGNLTEQGTVGTNLSTYSLNYTAKDGDDAAAAAITPIGTAGKNEGQLERPFGVAAADDGSFYVVDRINNRVVKYDKEGKVALQFGSTGSADGQFNDPRGIALAPDGTVWVADLGNDRIQAFSPTGTYLRKIKFSDPNAQPYAIAIAPNGSLWVTDIGIPRVVGFQDSPFANLGALQGKQSNPSDGGTDFASPVGVTVDKFNNVWVTDNGIDKVLEFDANRRWKFQFGTFGSGEGQMQGPLGIDIAPSGNLAVMERDTNRVEIFKPDGTFLRQYGSGGSASSQFTEAGGLSFAPDNTLLVADAGNHRITRWSHADQDPQSGAAKLQVKVDGVAAVTSEPGCTTKNCAISGSWTLNTNNYSGGAHKVEVTATDAVGIQTTKTIDIQTHGDHTNPTMAFSGTMTQQTSLGTTRPRYKLKAVASDPSPSEEKSSGVVMSWISVDGNAVDAVWPGCPNGGCSITREWTLNSNSYSPGPHTIESTAMDGAGHTTTKTLNITIARDTTPPVFAELGAFYTRPSGWTEQKKYPYEAVAIDENGYGVTSMQLKIDGTVVKGSSSECPDGGCWNWFAGGQLIDMANYSGGEHPAELIATDGAGNTRKRLWTINVDPDGHISATEATDTLEAVEVTAPDATKFTPVNGLVSEVIGEDGSNPQLVKEGGEFVSTGTPTPSSVGLDPEDGFALETTATDEGETVRSETIEVRPINVPEQAGDPELTDGSAAVIPNSGLHVDTILRPAFDGIMSFQDIRAPSAQKTFSWEVRLGEGEVLQLLDDHHAAIFWDDGTQAAMITAGAAHDADGKEVLTTIAVSEGNVITLTVHHDVPGVIYPVVAGVGYEGGFQQIVAEGPPPTEQAPEGEEAGTAYNGVVVNEWLFAAPTPATPAEAEVEASGMSIVERNSIEHRSFRYIGCHYMEDAVPPYSSSPTVEHCGNPFNNNSGPRGVAFSYAIRGSYFRLPGEWSKHAGGQQDHIDCDKMLDKSHYGDALIEWKYFITETKCEWYGKTKDGEPVKAPYGKHITPYGEWNWGRSYHWDGDWYHFGPIGLALYIWASKSKHIGRHETTCIDCS